MSPAAPSAGGLLEKREAHLTERGCCLYRPDNTRASFQEPLILLAPLSRLLSPLCNLRRYVVGEMGFRRSCHAQWVSGKSLQERQYWSVPTPPECWVWALLHWSIQSVHVLSQHSCLGDMPSRGSHHNLLLTGLPESTFTVPCSQDGLTPSPSHTRGSHAHHSAGTPPSSATLLPHYSHPPARPGSSCFTPMPGTAQPLGPVFIALSASSAFP